MHPVYVLAHFDDEYAAYPLLLRDAREGLNPWLLYVADYATPQLAQTRLNETRALVCSVGLDPARVRHVGRGVGALDGSVHTHLDAAHSALATALDEVGDVSRFVIAAWEGGHHDHDACAALALVAARSRRRGVDQFALYNGKGVPRPLFRAGALLNENGPRDRVATSFVEWCRFTAAVRFFPSQAKTWLGLWPNMFPSYMLASGFHTQRLEARRLHQRPHEGVLLYERMFGVPYETVRQHVDAYLAKHIA